MPTWPFVGRSSELERGASLLRRGLGVLLVGEAGIGKSALSRRLVNAETKRGAAVLTVTGRAVSSGTPFEAFSAIVAEPLGVPTAPTIARRVRQLSGSRRLTVLVDDIDLLDDDSGRVLLQLVSDGASMVVTARGPDVGEVAQTLWRDGRCERWELTGLAEGEVTDLLESALGGPVDPAAARAFWRRSGGNPLLLRELVGAARTGGGLVCSAGVWRLSGPPRLSGGLHELFAARLVALGDEQRSALELIAAGEPLPQDAALALVGEELLTGLEEAQLIAVESGISGTTVRLAHPLYGEVLRGDLSALRLRRLHLLLAREFEESPRPQPHDIVRAALWRIDSAEQDDPDKLLAAARVARSFSLETAERLARRAHETQKSLPATLLLALILTHLGRTAQADVLLAELPPEALAPRDREVLVYCAAVGRGLMIGDPRGGADMVSALRAGDAVASVRLRALQASLLAFDARPDEALSVGSAIVTDDGAPRGARALAAIGVVGALVWRGDFARAIATVDGVQPVVGAADVQQALPFAQPGLELFAIDALLQQGAFGRAEERTARLVRLAAETENPFGQTRAQFCQGWLALQGGRADTALRCFQRCVGTLTPFDSFMARYLHAMVAWSCAALGREPEAVAAVRSAEGLPAVPAWEPDVQLAFAAAAAAGLRMSAAADRAAWAAAMAAQKGMWAVALRACHDAARYGAARSVLPEARVAAGHAQGPLPVLRLDHVSALAAGSAPGLEDCAQRFAEVGMPALAAEAATQAASAFALQGEQRAVTRCAAQAARLKEGTDVITPWLAGASSAVPLTAREQQVAAMAGAGESDAGIAERLGISIRTVQTHLEHAYQKLGVNRRTELSARLSR